MYSCYNISDDNKLIRTVILLHLKLIDSAGSNQVGTILISLSLPLSSLYLSLFFFFSLPPPFPLPNGNGLAFQLSH